MAIIRSLEASSSTRYHVFLSFRGEDTRTTFTDHLYTALVQHGFRTFRDDDELEKGESLKPELENAICQSKSSIVVISENYASSRWCLDELVMILERRRTSGHFVLPVFYHVEPSEVRKQTGKTAEAFEKYENQCEEEVDHEGKRKLMERIKGWRSALTEVADLIGLDLKNEVDRHESKFIHNKIIKEIGVKVSRTPLYVDPYIIGIDSQVEKINMWLQDGPTDDRVRAICGMGGIGKTTIAKIVYNQNFDSFDGSSFLTNIREVSEQPKDSLRLQRQLLSDISRREHGKIHNIDEGLTKIRNLICHKRVLLVLDDVEEVDSLYDVLGRPDWLFPGSKVIITTRHKSMQKSYQNFWVEKLGQDESIKLLSFHAFGEDYCLESCIEHTKRAVQICEGLPLALKVIGSSLSGKSEDEWVSELAKLEAIPHSQILKKLQISYDSLDVYGKRLFLDIACFFVGSDKDYTIKILEKCVRDVTIRIQNLIDRCLLTNNFANVLTMHRLIQDMGQNIICEESAEAGMRSRLWNNDEAFDVLRNETGTRSVEGLTLDRHMSKETGNHAKKRPYDEFCNEPILSKHVSSLKRRCFSIISGASISTTLTSSKDIYLRTDAFKSMTKLRLLQLNYVQLTGSYDNFPRSLIWLCWHGFPLKSIPAELSLENLVALDLRHSRLEQVWKEPPFLESLKILDLSYSKWLERTPNFKGLYNLERLVLKGCVRLVEVCESIGNLEMLDLLDLQDCKTLRKLPRNIGNLGSLKTLVISGCNIEELPSEMSNMKSLEVLNGDGNVINPLHNSGWEVKWWQRIGWSILKTPRKGPETLWASLPCSLKLLSISGCNLSDDSFPLNFGNLPLLQDLNLSGNPFRRLPNGIESLSKLKSLNITECHKLQSLELNSLLTKSVQIYAEKCRSLEKVMSLSGSADIWIDGCNKLVELIEDCFKKEDGTKFDFTRITNITGCFEYGIFSIYLHSGEIPMFSGEKCEGSSSISFAVPYSFPPHRRIQYLNLWVTFKRTEINRYDIFGMDVKIENKTKELTWIHCPNYFTCDKYVGWLSRWRFGNQLESGDEITLSFNSDKSEVKECGFKIVYQEEEEEENGSSSSSSPMEDSHQDFPAPRLSTGEYVLYKSFDEDPNEDYWFPKDCNGHRSVNRLG